MKNLIFILFICIGCVNYSPVDNGSGAEDLDAELLEDDAGEDLDDAGELGNDKDGEDLPEEEVLTISMDIESRDKGGYLEGPWVTVAYEKQSDKGNVLTASRIALLARLLLDVWEEWQYPNIEQVTEQLSNFHVFALHMDELPDEDNARLYSPELWEQDPQAALDKVENLHAWCDPNGDERFVDVSTDAHFFIVIDASFLLEYWGRETVLHEMMHAALFVGLGDSDGDHDMPDIWLPRSGVDNGSMMAEVLSRYP